MAKIVTADMLNTPFGVETIYCTSSCVCCKTNFPDATKRCEIIFERPLNGFKYIIDQINCELTNGIRGYLQMKSKKRGMGSAKVDMGFPLREKNKQNFKRS